MTDTLARPPGTCLTHRHSEGRSWVMAHSGYLTCDGCYDRIRRALSDVARRYHLLNPRPGASSDHGSRGAPGFGSRSPASDHVIAMKDPRSSRDAKPWRAADGRLHWEDDSPPLSVFGVLDTLAWDIAEQRSGAGPKPGSGVLDLTRWLDAHLDWITRHPVVLELDEALRELLSQLRPMTGDPGAKPVANCTRWIEAKEGQCGAPLYLPRSAEPRAPDEPIRHVPVIECRACGETYDGLAQLRLRISEQKQAG